MWMLSEEAQSASAMPSQWLPLTFIFDREADVCARRVLFTLKIVRIVFDAGAPARQRS